MPGKCVLNPMWTQTFKWAIKAEDRHKAFCTCCRKTIDLGKMGEGALKSHDRSEKHVSNFRASNSATKSTLQSFVIPPPPPRPNSDGASGTAKITADYVQKNDVLKAEILWCFQTVSTHCSYKSNEIVGKLFQTMFPDSKVADRFQCGERKSAYMTVYGIAEYLKTLILKDIDDYFVVLFDESLNKKIQSKQMDIHVRYWKDCKVTTRYLGSVFMGHGTATDMVEHFKKGMQDLEPRANKMVQISMDGPNVNWKFFDIMKTQMKKDHDITLINIGSCGLHVMHNAFKAGADSSDWKISSFLSSLYYLFKDSPARREDFKKVTGSSTLPLKFVSHRWMENVPVCERALQIFRHIMVYIKKVQEKEISKPSCKSYEVVSSTVRDPLIKAKLEYFKYVALYLQPFLGNYQSDKPMTPFLYTDLHLVVKVLMQKVLKPEVIAESSKLFSIDLDEKKSYLGYTKVDLGFSTAKEVNEAMKEKRASEKEIMEFKMEARNFVLKLLKKLLEKYPATYSLVRYLSMLNPKEMAEHPVQCKAYLKKILSHFVTCNRVLERNCDEILRQFEDFLSNIPAIGTDIFLNFKQNEDRVDEFYCRYIPVDKYDKLFDVIKICLVLSHGQAAVERGFSVNKEGEVVNLKEESLVAQRLICDYVKSVGGVLNVPITPELIRSAAQSRQRYERYLQDQRQMKKTTEELRKRKCEEEELETLHKRAKQAKLDIEALNESADSYSVKAEKESNFSHLAKANSLREKAKEKKELLSKLEQDISIKQKELRKT